VPAALGLCDSAGHLQMKLLIPAGENNDDILFLQINDLQNQVQIKQTEINDLLNKETELQDKFQMATSDSKFADFLRKIYKKKYKPPRVRSADDGKKLKQAQTANILYASTHGFCPGGGGKIFVCKCTF
jgi:hypothetical protein